MPWNPEDAERHTKKANDLKRKRMWAEIANSVLSDTGDEGRAVREANSAVAAGAQPSNTTFQRWF
jgi:uncharacterized protein YdaT